MNEKKLRKLGAIPDDYILDKKWYNLYWIAKIGKKIINWGVKLIMNFIV